MATALKHRQRSRRSYQQNQKVIGSVAVAAIRKSNFDQYVKQASTNWMDKFQQIFSMIQKGDR